MSTGGSEPKTRRADAVAGHPVVSAAEWYEARRALLAMEKELTRASDTLAEARRALPWVRVEKAYEFGTESGPKSLSELFGDRSQLLVYHFMFGPDWDEGCRSCSFWADNFNGTTEHLRHRDVTMLAVSRAPLEKLLKFKVRMGWDFEWVSSAGGDFNFDFGVSFEPEDGAADAPNYNYNYDTISFSGPEAPGVSVFVKGNDGAVYHTYSTYARGLDILNGAYRYLDLVPKGRDEDDLPYGMAWLRLHDSYEVETSG